MIQRPFPLNVDVHVHLAALPDGHNGCYISPKMLRSFVLRMVAWRQGLNLNDRTGSNRLYLDKLLSALRGSRFIQKAVILGLDGVYDETGTLDEGRTEFMIPNDHILGTARVNADCLLPGVSINPMRRDAVDEVHRCAGLGAALVKILPNTQGFDPAEERFRPFYHALAARKIPLLSHIGYEFALLGRNQSVGDPGRLQLALEEGVTVIAAHGVSTGLFFYEKHWKVFQDLVKRHSNFFWDASALSLANRVGMLLKLRGRPDLHDRMVFGTDYPLPSNAFPAILAGERSSYGELRKMKNPFDRHYRLLEILGFPLPSTDHDA